MAYSRQRRIIAGRMRGFATRAYNDPQAYTAAARLTFRESFAQQVDPEGVLPPEERSARADAAYRLHMTGLALKSAEARAKRAAGRPARKS